MDAVRKIIHDTAKARRLSLSKLSKNIGRNHSYLFQFINRGKPAILPEHDRYALAELLELDEAQLRDPKAPAPPGRNVISRQSTGGDGHPIEPAKTPPTIAKFLTTMTDGSIEAWQLDSDVLEGAGYLADDFVVVDLARHPTAGDIVLAELADTQPRAPIFRINTPPYLLAAQQGRPTIKPLLVDNDRVIVRGVVIASARLRTQS
jgi:hypothetical protein